MDEDGNEKLGQSKADTTLKSHDQTINQLLEIVETLKLEVNDINDKLEKGQIGGGDQSKGTATERLEVMDNMVKQNYQKLEEVTEELQKL